MDESDSDFIVITTDRNAAQKIIDEKSKDGYIVSVQCIDKTKQHTSDGYQRMTGTGGVVSIRSRLITQDTLLKDTLLGQFDNLDQNDLIVCPDSLLSIRDE